MTDFRDIPRNVVVRMAENTQILRFAKVDDKDNFSDNERDDRSITRTVINDPLDYVYGDEDADGTNATDNKPEDAAKRSASPLSPSLYYSPTLLDKEKEKEKPSDKEEQEKSRAEIVPRFSNDLQPSRSRFSSRNQNWRNQRDGYPPRQQDSQWQQQQQQQQQRRQSREERRYDNEYSRKRSWQATQTYPPIRRNADRSRSPPPASLARRNETVVATPQLPRVNGTNVNKSLMEMSSIAMRLAFLNKDSEAEPINALAHQFAHDVLIELAPNSEVGRCLAFLEKLTEAVACTQQAKEFGAFLIEQSSDSIKKQKT